MTAPLVFLDTETDGVHPDRKVWEVGMIRRDKHGSHEISFFVDIDLSTADPFGLQVGKFYERHPLGRQLSAAGTNDRPTFAPIDGSLYGGAMLNRRAAAMRVARWTHGAHVIGAVPNFDTESLAPVLREAGLTPAWHYHLIDVESMIIGFIHACAQDASPAREAELRAAVALPWKSDDLSRVIGVEPPTEAERHTALGDARWAARIWDRITATPE